MHHQKKEEKLAQICILNRALSLMYDSMRVAIQFSHLQQLYFNESQVRYNSEMFQFKKNPIFMHVHLQEISLNKSSGLDFKAITI
jgi:hypothetical protein